MSVFIVGPRDARLEELVRGSGIAAAPVWLADLTTLAAGDAAQPDVVLVDLRGQQQLPPALPALKRHHPSTGVIIVAASLEPTLMLAAMRAGVTECIAEPLTAEDITASLHRVAGGLDSTPSGQVFAFVGAKGGVGTTTAAVNVATALGKLSRSPALLVDLHAAYGDAAVLLGAEPRYSVLDALENMHRLDETFFSSLICRTSAGVDLLASSERPVVPTFDGRRVSTLIEFASRHAPYAVLDVPRSDPAVLDGLDQVSVIVVVANQELATVRNAVRMATALRTRYGKTKVRIVLNRADRRAEIGHDDVERALGGPIAHQVPSDYRGALYAMNKGRPLALLKEGPLGDSFRTLARELAGLKPQAQPERATGLIGRIAALRSA
jgi:pilus assembly protein CpaE